MKWFNTEC